MGRGIISWLLRSLEDTAKIFKKFKIVPRRPDKHVDHIIATSYNLIPLHFAKHCLLLLWDGFTWRFHHVAFTHSNHVISGSFFGGGGGGIKGFIWWLPPILNQFMPVTVSEKTREGGFKSPPDNRSAQVMLGCLLKHARPFLPVLLKVPQLKKKNHLVIFLQLWITPNFFFSSIRTWCCAELAECFQGINFVQVPTLCYLFMPPTRRVREALCFRVVRPSVRESR